MTDRAKQIAEKIAEGLYNKKAQDILIIDIADMTVIADCFVVASGTSAIQTKAFCDEVQRVMLEDGVAHTRLEGYAAGRWIVLDYEDVLVHIFHKEEREFYNLERLWDDGFNVAQYPPQKLAHSEG